jgi:hypothetical protein
MNFLGDCYEDNFAEGYYQSVEEEFVVPEDLVADMNDQKTLFVYNDIHDFMASNSCKNVLLQ